MAEFLVLRSDDEKRIHPHALERLKELKDDIIQEVPQLDQLSITELNKDAETYLSNEEIADVNRYKNTITKWIVECMDIGSGYSRIPYDECVIHPMLEIKRLIKTIYERKEERN